MCLHKDPFFVLLHTFKGKYALLLCLIPETQHLLVIILLVFPSAPTGVVIVIVMLSFPRWLLRPGITTFVRPRARHVLFLQLGLVAKDDICTRFSFLTNDRKYS